MADGINIVMLAGNVGSDPQLKKFDNGGALLTFRLATNASYVDRNNERKEITDWHNVTVKGEKRATALSDFIKKGSKVAVTGRLSTRSYEQNGEKKFVTEVIADKIVLSGSGNGAPKGDAPPSDGTDFDPSTMGVEDDQP